MFNKQSKSKIIAVATVLIIANFSLMPVENSFLSFLGSNIPLLSSSKELIISKEPEKVTEDFSELKTPDVKVVELSPNVKGVEISPDIRIDVNVENININYRWSYCWFFCGSRQGDR